MAAKFIDEINRLFEEMVRTPWQPITATPKPQPKQLADWEVEIPLRGVDRGDISVSTEGRQLTVAVRRRATRHRSAPGTDVTTTAQEEFRQSFLLPAGADLRSVQIGLEDDVLRIRVGLKK